MTDEELLRLGYRDHPLRSGKVRVPRTSAVITRVGLKVVQLEPWRRERVGFLSLVAGLPRLKVILLRRNMLDAVRSLEQAKATGRWIRYCDDTDDTAPPQVRIDPQFARMWFAEMARFDARMRQIFTDVPLLDLAYERLAGCPDAAMNEVWSFLRVRRHDGERGLVQRQERRSRRAAILNLDELRAAFRGTGHEALLDEAEPGLEPGQ
jgi:hypothetical protein